MYEYRRTCNRCGTVRYIAPDIAEAKPRRQAKAVGWATPLFGKKRQEIRANQALVDGQNATIRAAQQCGNCGSGAYTEERVD